MSKLNSLYSKKSKVNTLSLNIKFPEGVQKRICEFINAGYYDNFCNVKIEKKGKKKAVLTCEVKNLQPLQQYLKSPISKESFLDIVIKTIDVIKFCGEHQLNPSNLELRKKAIFIDPNIKAIKYIYWPIVNNQNYVTPKDFFKDLIKDIQLTNSPIDDWQHEYNLFLNDLKPFSLRNFEDLIMKLQGKDVKTKEIAPMSSLLDADTDLDATVSIQNSSYSEENVYNPILEMKRNNAFNRARVVNRSKTIHKKSAYLFNKNRNTKISITKDIFKIGKARQLVDYPIPNDAVSRHHANIIFEKGSYYIVDQQSTNHTFVNKKLIPSYQPYRLRSGDYIRLANEDFIFECE